jgi:hypothetical protein
VPHGLTSTQLIAAAKRRGFAVSSHQLKRLRLHGLLQRPAQNHPAGTRGSVSTYPPDALEQLITVCRHRLHEQRFDELRFDVWWDDGWVETRHLRDSLGLLLDAPITALRAHRVRYDDPGEAALGLVEGLDSKLDDRSPMLRLLRYRLRGADPTLETFFVAVLTALFGGEPIWDTPDAGTEQPEVSPRETVERALGLNRAAADDPTGAGPLLDEIPDVEALFSELKATGLLHLQPSRRIAELSDDELELARLTGKRLIPLELVAAELGEAYGRDTAGLGAFAVVGKHDQRRLRLFMFWFAAAAPQLATGESARHIAAALDMTAPQLEAYRALINELPGYKPYLVPGREDRLYELPAEEREQLAEAVRDWLRRHPEFAAQVEVDA